MIEFNHPLVALFLFAIGACVGSFLNVVVYRMPLGKSLITPPSACPKCGHGLAWYDNVPVFGWLWLRGKCRYCQNPISVRYPVIEFITGLLFAGHYLMLFKYGWGPYQQIIFQTPYGTLQAAYRLLDLERDWPILLLHLWLIATLLAASLIDLEHYIIPLELCWWTAGVGVAGHALLRADGSLGNLHFPPGVDALTLGGGLGLLLSIAFLRVGWLKRSFEDDAPLLEMELAQIKEEDRPDPWPPTRVRAEIRREMLFVLPIILGAAVAFGLTRLPAIAQAWEAISAQKHISGALGALAGGLVGGGVVWLFRILGSYGFGREAMGLGDVHLMFGVGCVIGPGASTVAFFLAPAFGLSIAVVQLFVRGRREIPYGPYLSLGTLVVLLFYTPIAIYLEPGLSSLVWAVQTMTGLGGGDNTMPMQAGWNGPALNGSTP